MSIKSLINNAQAIASTTTNSTVTETKETTMTTSTNSIANLIAASMATAAAKVTPVTEAPATTWEPVDTTELAPLNVNALSSTITAKLFLLTANPMLSVKVACATVAAVTLVRTTGNEEGFKDYLLESLEEAKLSTAHVEKGPLAKALADKKQAGKEAKKYYIPSKEELKAVREERGTLTKQSFEVSYDEEVVLAALGRLKLLTRENKMGNALIDLIEQRKEGYAPIPVGQKFVRKNKLVGLEKGQLKDASGLAMESILAQEASQFTVDGYMLNIINQAQPLLDKAGFEDKESYVLAGCNAMDSDAPYTNEFKYDTRFRAYQASCFGPNGQSSDRSRALMDLWNVSTDYDVMTVVGVIMAEVDDMVAISGEELQQHLEAAASDPVTYAVESLQIMKSVRPVKKVWSFIKAAHILAELAAGNKPAIGMAVGLDAKCSGPQYGGLMAGDENLAAACGFTLAKVEDAYQRCITILEASKKFSGMSRNGIKKTFMGVFYGQSWGAFQDVAQMKKDEQFELVKMLLDGNSYISEERAKEFHKLVTSSFGKKLVYIRNQVLKLRGKVEGRFNHMMPDGVKVQMNYKVSHNIMGEVVGIDTICPDVLVVINGVEFKFIKLALKTKEVDADNFIRTAFVNMVQAVDALIARLIIVHLKRLGATHIVGIHDCFRVNVNELHLLEQAIVLAYDDLFGSVKNIKTTDLPMGTDIMGMFFEGLERVAMKGDDYDEVEIISQFTKSGIRRFQKCNGVFVHELIKRLGETYYFAK